MHLTTQDEESVLPLATQEGVAYVTLQGLSVRGVYFLILNTRRLPWKCQS